MAHKLEVTAKLTDEDGNIIVPEATITVIVPDMVPEPEPEPEPEPDTSREWPDGLIEGEVSCFQPSPDRFAFRVPEESPAYGTDNLRWTDGSLDEPGAYKTEKQADGSYLASSAKDNHILKPGEKRTIHVYYHMSDDATVAGRSDKSVVSFEVENPTSGEDEGGDEDDDPKPDPKPEPDLGGKVVKNQSELTEAIRRSKEGDVIKLADRDWEHIVWPVDTSHRMTLTSENGALARVMGIYLGMSEVPDYVEKAGRAFKASNLTIRGINVRPPILTHFQDKNGKRTDIRDKDGRGWGWRADYSFPRIKNTGESAGFMGIKVGGGCNGVVITDNLIEHCAKGINSNGRDLTVSHNTFSECCEDGMIIWGGRDVEFIYNEWVNQRGVSLEAAKMFGWANKEPVHQDFLQIACNSAGQFLDGLLFGYNVLEDDTVRVHGLLCNNRYVSQDPRGRQSSMHRRISAVNNLLRVTHTTAIQITYADGVLIDKNKIIRIKEVAGSKKNDVAIVVGGWDTGSAQHLKNVTVSDNEARKYKPEANGMKGWQWSNNKVTNDANSRPKGWQDIENGGNQAGMRIG